MSNMKNIEMVLSEMVEFYPTMICEYDVDFHDDTVSVFQVNEKGEYQLEVEDNKLIQSILMNGIMLPQHEDYHTDPFEPVFYTVTLHRNGKYPYNLFFGTITIPAYYNGKYYKINFDLKKELA